MFIGGKRKSHKQVYLRKSSGPFIGALNFALRKRLFPVLPLIGRRPIVTIVG